MKIRELLPLERIHAPLPASSVGEALARLAGMQGDPHDAGDAGHAREAEAPEGEGARLLARLLRREGGTFRTASPHAVLGILEGRPRDALHLGLASRPLPELPGPGGLVPPGGTGAHGPRIVVLVERTRDSRITDEGIGKILAALAQPQVEVALLRASGPAQVTAVAPLMELALTGPLRVSDALVPMAFRVFPDTPVAEIVDLMARKGIGVVPVVGESLQVVGILTAGDALRLLLERHGSFQVAARDVMTRTVLCVTEDQALADAARMMVKRKLRQLPVVRDGEFVGFLTRESVLRTLHGGGGGDARDGAGKGA